MKNCKRTKPAKTTMTPMTPKTKCRPGFLGVVAVLGVMALALLAGCSVTKVEYEKNDKGEVSYRIYRNDHWLKTESTGIRGGMTDGGKFEFNAEGMKSSPSEEFNRTMQTYTTAFVQLAQIAAAAYNPSGTGVKVSETASAPQQTTAATSTATPAAATSPEGAADGNDNTK